eukprot:CAMPEP_0202978950 /NCGR_PEP_ID=MMETSP1396-20130829/85228_1 /ASSEMBLY_ACC=CAM_ASM_000872 /TAXON_ID= /ORGANISM="Pseudokeronopsis sp., Strain Brazil" /LENGTH=98 /DNA_ID=CAMNT_0049718145 /DNA_START=1430 /DNA_END=1726 /DNA_ORIENTATION=+
MPQKEEKPRSSFEEVDLEEQIKYSSPSVFQKSLSQRPGAELELIEEVIMPNVMERSPTFSSGDKGDYNNNDSYSNSLNEEDNISLTKQITLEEKEKIK